MENIHEILNAELDKSDQKRAKSNWWTATVSLIWLTSLVVGSVLLIRKANSKIDELTLHLLDVETSYFETGFAFLLVCTLFLSIRSKRKVWIFLGSLLVSMLALRQVGIQLHEIEFVRTPPCEGMHSVDPGSGSGCLDGMREEFTVQQLRDYYSDIERRARTSSIHSPDGGNP